MSENRSWIRKFSNRLDRAEEISTLVMPYFPRGNLAHLLEQQGSLSLHKTLLYIEQAAAALDYAHKRGVIHRDLKPSNFLLHTDGHLVLADFGIAHMMRTTSTTFISQPETILGTPEYMAPEMIYKQPVDYHADIYELGIVLFQMLRRITTMASTGTTIQPPIF